MVFEGIKKHVCQRTNEKILQMLDNAPENSKIFKEDDIKVIFSPPNVTLWKQPMDIGIIAAFKKRVNIIHIKKVLDYFDSSKETKNFKAELKKIMRQGAAGVEFEYRKKSFMLHEYDSVENPECRNQIISDINETILTSVESLGNISNTLDKLKSSLNVFESALERLEFTEDTTIHVFDLNIKQHVQDIRKIINQNCSKQPTHIKHKHGLPISYLIAISLQF
ncbi:hypothetical protein BB559_006044 [Furculomyces boomerangus]|uniref:DDE-1 domain-containing protein n=2 Tax=Harpellales TaxID=61421 RepID=A0A2T9Y561_9FUNG|nr:hypothetical protein BB559_006044 [Furculomyces boomerangus]PWA01353.1 hypothetical protein BB558_002559 [Smittium angustum]